MHREFILKRIFAVSLTIACFLLFVASNAVAQQYYPQYSDPQPAYRQNSTPYSPPYSDEGTYYDSQANTSELGLRYLKLANSYREARNSDMAQYYAQRGLNIVRGRGSRYWEAVANEYLGLIYRDMGDNASAVDFLRRADGIYRTVINPLRSESSVDAVQKVISDVEFGYRYLYPPKSLENYRWNTEYPYSSRSYTGRYRSAETLESERLQRTNTLLQARLNELELRLRNMEQPVYYGR